MLFEPPRIFFGKSGRLNFEVGPVTTGCFAAGCDGVFTAKGPETTDASAPLSLPRYHIPRRSSPHRPQSLRGAFHILPAPGIREGGRVVGRRVAAVAQASACAPCRGIVSFPTACIVLGGRGREERRETGRPNDRERVSERGREGGGGGGAEKFNQRS